MARVDPAAWRVAGEIFHTEAARFAAVARRDLGPLVTTGGADGVPVLDEMIAGVLPALLDAVNPTVDGISKGLTDEGTSLMERGETFQGMRADIEEWEEEEFS